MEQSAIGNSKMMELKAAGGFLFHFTSPAALRSRESVHNTGVHLSSIAGFLPAHLAADLITRLQAAWLILQVS